MKLLIQRILLLLVMTLMLSGSLQAQEQFATWPMLPAGGYQSVKVFDRQGKFVGRLLPEQRYWTSIERIPVFLQRAVVAVEDSRFYEHDGIDLRGIARAVVKDVVKRRLAEGGSTITQQLIKNRYLSGEKTVDRKLKEGMMALEFEKKYTKRQILEMYLNEIYYGNGAWGIAQAARIYFDKNPEELTDTECSLLAGIPKNPGRYNPLGKPADVALRRTVVLKRMAEVGVLTPGQLRQQLTTTAAPIPQDQAHWYLGLVKARLLEKYGPKVFEIGGLEVTAGLDLALQLQAEQALKEGMPKNMPQLQGALVAIDPASGDLLAVVGGTEHGKGGFNRALQAKRQPGSAIKPFIYATALEQQELTAASRLSDAPVAYPLGNGNEWEPKNYDNKSHGEMSLRQALASSNNVIAVKLLDTVGLPAFTGLAGRCGLSFRNQNLSLALGTDEQTLQELVQAYTPFANAGIRSEPRSIIRIFDSYRKVWTDNPPVLTPAIQPEVAAITTNMLKDVLVSGTAKGLKKFSQKYPAAGKTGTTNDYRDAWFVGYTPTLVAGVWMGYDKPRPGGRGFTGGSAAAPVWERFMRHALAGRPATEFNLPEQLLSLSIDPASGLLATDDCPRRRTELFISGTEPDEYCTPPSASVQSAKPPVVAPQSDTKEQPKP